MYKKTRVDELIEAIQGTCKSLGEICDSLGFDEEDLTIKELQELDSEVFECCSCGWWYEIGEHYDDGVCHDCYLSKQEEEY